MARQRDLAMFYNLLEMQKIVGCYDVSN